MLRTTVRSAARAVRSAPPPSSYASGSRRLLSSKAADKPRTWKGAAARWGVAFGALYWYNTSPLFADELPPQTIPAPPQFSDADLPTVESVIETKRKEAEVKAQKAAPAPSEEKPTETAEPSEKTAEKTDKAADGDAAAASEPGSLEALEEEAGQQAAFNPETGEINWDCPCLGGMAHGPCGEEFKAAFSCFVYSKEEPKGIECIEKFQGMQTCFRKYPEIYGAELDNEDEENASGDAKPPAEGADASKPETDAPKSQAVESTSKSEPPQEKAAPSPPSKPEAKPAKATKEPSATKEA